MRFSLLSLTPIGCRGAACRSASLRRVHKSGFAASFEAGDTVFESAGVRQTCGCGESFGA
jgi:hypothetical protein